MLARVFESPQIDDINKANPEFREVPFDAHSQVPPNRAALLRP